MPIEDGDNTQILNQFDNKMYCWQIKPLYKRILTSNIVNET